MLEPIHVHNWRRICDRVTTSGQPSEAELAQIRALGVVTVINLGLHTHARALKDEAGVVAGLGMVYRHIPVAFDDPTEADFDRFCSAMEAASGAPLHVHCILNYRVSAFFYRYQRDVLHLDEAAARAVMDSIWAPGGAWARFIGDVASIELPHRPAPGAAH